MDLDDPTVFSEVDPHGARKVLAEFPAQCRAALSLEATPRPDGPPPELVIVAGMGGSAAGGDLLASCAADRVGVPVLVHRGYGLPASAGPRALVLVSSYSGETAETLSAFETARGRGVPVVAITSGGRLATRALRERLPLVRLPGGLMPRMALGYLLLPAVRTLAAMGMVVAATEELTEAGDLLVGLGATLGPEVPTENNEAKRLASALGGHLAVVYGGPVTGAAAHRWKADLAENAKAFALAGALPEMNHNEIEAWRSARAGDMHVIMLRDPEEPPEVARRFAVLRELIAPTAAGVVEVWPTGRGRLGRLLELVYLGQWVSYYLAALRGVDPWTVPLLDELKRRVQGAQR